MVNHTSKESVRFVIRKATEADAEALVAIVDYLSMWPELRHDLGRWCLQDTLANSFVRYSGLYQAIHIRVIEIAKFSQHQVVFP